jgi:hypothetical protein
MTRKTASSAPEAETPAAPLPAEGGSYTRNADGSLTRRDEAPPATDTPEKEA